MNFGLGNLKGILELELTDLIISKKFRRSILIQPNLI